MKIIVDTHTHTVSSGHHTKDTVRELALKAKEKGLEYLAVTDHSFGMIGGAKTSYFTCLKMLSPKSIYGVNMLYGAETNILNSDGKIDLSHEVMAKLDFCIASLHSDVIKPSTERQNTLAICNAMDNKYINILGHAENSEYPVNFPAICLKARETNTIIELNASSVMKDGYRGNQRPLAKALMTECKRFGCYVSLGSDSHGRENVGNFNDCLEILSELNYPTELVVNYDINLFKSIIDKKRK